MSCVETLRKEGFKGRIVLVSRENDLPYDRPKLSKVSFSGVEYDNIVLQLVYHVGVIFNVCVF